MPDPLRHSLEGGSRKLTCSKCGRQNESTLDTCAYCGARLRVRCRKCGERNIRSARRCIKCGAPLHRSRWRRFWKRIRGENPTATLVRILLAVGIALAAYFMIVRISETALTPPPPADTGDS